MFVIALTFNSTDSGRDRLTATLHTGGDALGISEIIHRTFSPCSSDDIQETPSDQG